jgi:hypothetical protein
MTRTTRSNKITITQEELEALIQKKVAESSLWRYRIQPIIHWLWQSRFAWFLAGALIAAGVMNFPFASGGAGWTRIWSSQISILSDSPSQIALAAPNSTESDKTKRQTIVQVYRRTAGHIRQGTVTSIHNAMTELRMGTINLQSGEWQKTNDRLDAFLSKDSDLETLADKLEEIAEVFSR